MNWFVISLVFHVLRLNLCVALSPGCPDQLYLDESGLCVDCTVCKEPEKFVIQPCSAHQDTLCGSVNLLLVGLPGVKIKAKNTDDFSKQFLTINSEAELSKENITNILKKLSEPAKAISVPKIDNTDNYYYDDDTDDDDDYNYEDDNSTITSSVKSSNSTPNNEKTPLQQSSRDLANDPLAIQLIPYSYFPDVLDNKEVSVEDPDTLSRNTQKSKKMNSKESNIDLNDHSLKIGDTKFKIGDEKSGDDRWLQLSRPHAVNKKISVYLADKPAFNKKGSTFFSSGEKQTDQEYVKEMTKLLNETSSVFDKNPTTINLTADDNDNNILKNLDDVDDDDDDEEEDDDDDEDEDDEADEDEDDEDVTDGEPPVYNDFIPSNNSDRTDSVEKSDADMEDDYDLQESDFYPDRTFQQSSSNDIYAEPFVSTANWQILILVAAMSACLLFFIVISAYICIYMRKKRHIKTTFVTDVEDLSVHANLMQHAGFEPDDTNNIKHYITHLRNVKSNNEKLPKIYTRSKEKK